ncbi:MAG: chemotaxis protein CheC [Armatimonadota bacterium]
MEIKLSEMQLGALREVGNIGAGHAATALSQIVDKTIMITVSSLDIFPVCDICKVLNGFNKKTVVVSMNMLGDIRGGVLLVLAEKDAFALVDVLQKQELGTTVKLSDLEESALKELGSILTFSYLDAIGSLLELSIIPSVPVLASGAIEEVSGKILEDISKRFETVFCIETEFIETNNKIKGFFLLVPEVNSLSLIIKALGVADK